MLPYSASSLINFQGASHFVSSCNKTHFAIPAACFRLLTSDALPRAVSFLASWDPGY